MSGTARHQHEPRVSRRPFGSMPDGTPVELFIVDNGYIELSAISYGGIITSLCVPDRHGRRATVVLGFDYLEPYLDNPAYFGSVIGRYANRIAGGRFSLDGVDHALRLNDGPSHLHGGPGGFSRQVWNATIEGVDDGEGFRLHRTSPAGEEGYPGAMDVDVTYRVSGDTVEVNYAAASDAPTLVNLTQHSYFNLAQETSPTVLDHELMIAADAYTPVGAHLIPSGEIVSVTGTPFDFRASAGIRERADLSHPQLRAAGGFDHNYVLARAKRRLGLAAILRSRESGRTLEVRTTEPGLQFYDGHMLDGRFSSSGRVFGKHAGLCLETQHFPDSPHHAEFPPVVLRPGEHYRSTTTWRFRAR